MTNVVPLPQRFWFLLALLLAWSAGVSGPAHAQRITVKNGGEIEMRNGGTWDLADDTLSLGGVGSTARIDEAGEGRFANGWLKAVRALNSPSWVNVAGLGATLTTSVDLGDVTVVRGHTAQSASDGTSIERFYDISYTKNTSTNLDATLTHHYTDAELNGLSEGTLAIYKSEDGGDTWFKFGQDSRDATADTVTVSGIDSFSRWTLAGESSFIPVELASFEGTAVEDGAVRLTWQTASERNNAEFRIQRRASEGGEWTTLGTREGAGTTREAHSYRFTDTDLPYTADSLHYRLKQVDVDGTVETLDPITVARGAVERLQLNAPYPNPAAHQVTVRYAVPPEEDGVGLRVYDVLGRAVHTVKASDLEGRREIQLDVSGLSSGVYILRLRAGTTTRTKRFTVVK